MRAMKTFRVSKFCMLKSFCYVCSFLRERTEIFQRARERCDSCSNFVCKMFIMIARYTSTCAKNSFKNYVA